MEEQFADCDIATALFLFPFHSEFLTFVLSYCMHSWSASNTSSYSYYPASFRACWFFSRISRALPLEGSCPTSSPNAFFVICKFLKKNWVWPRATLCEKHWSIFLHRHLDHLNRKTTSPLQKAWIHPFHLRKQCLLQRLFTCWTTMTQGKNSQRTS